MEKIIKYLIPFAIFFALISFHWIGVKGPSKSTSLQEDPTTLSQDTEDKGDMKFPSKPFELPTVTDPNKKVTQAIFQGHVTVLNTWASWCGACREEQDLLLSLSKEPGIYWVGLNLGDNLIEAQRMLQLYGNPYHETIFDPELELAGSLKSRGTPEFFILDKKGVIVYRHSGMINETIWREELLPVIKNLQ